MVKLSKTSLCTFSFPIVASKAFNLMKKLKAIDYCTKLSHLCNKKFHYTLHAIIIWVGGGAAFNSPVCKIF